MHTSLQQGLIAAQGDRLVNFPAKLFSAQNIGIRIM